MKQQTIRVSAVNNTEVILFDEYKLPHIVPINKIISNFEVSEGKTTTTTSGLELTEYIFNEPLYIHSINTNNKINLNKVESIFEFKNLKSMYKVRPYLLKPYDITHKNFSIDRYLNIQHLDTQNINNTQVLKNNKYYGKKIDRLEDLDLDLTTDLGYILGQWYSRGYIDKTIKNNPKFTWVALENDSAKLLMMINKVFHTGTFHRGKIDKEKYDYIQIIDPNYNEKLINIFISNKNFINWIYSAPNAFLDGLIYGIFFTNGTISFNKDKSKAYMTIKFLNHTLAEKFSDLLNIRYNLQGVLSLVPDKKYCKISHRFNKQFLEVIENGFKYGYIDNPNKSELLEELKTQVNIPESDAKQFSEVNFKVQKLTLDSGFNFKIENSKAFCLLNNVIVPTV